jgi:hypothetical protein
LDLAGSLVDECAVRTSVLAGATARTLHTASMRQHTRALARGTCTTHPSSLVPILSGATVLSRPGGARGIWHVCLERSTFNKPWFNASKRGALGRRRH